MLNTILKIDTLHCIKAISMYFSYTELKKLEKPLVFYMTPEASKGFGLLLWDYCRDNFIIPIIFPRQVHTWFKSNHSGVFRKIQQQWNTHKTFT